MLRECLTFIKVFTNQKVINVERNENILKDQEVALVEENQYINLKKIQSCEKKPYNTIL